MTGLEIYTDAGFKDGVSTHHWRLVDGKSKAHKRRTFKGYESDNNKAELQTIESAIKWLNKKNKSNITIYTDSKYTEKLLNGDSEVEDIKYLKWIMKGLNIKVKWVSRKTKQIKLADYYCSQLMDTVFRRVEFNKELVQC